MARNHKSAHIYENALKQSLTNSLYNPIINSNKLSNKTAVIVDPRYDELMESVIKNFMYYMGPKDWNLLIISSSIYKNKIQETFPNALFLKIDESMIYYDSELIPNINIATYNKIFLSQQFWDSMPTEHIAIFQKDCIMFKMFDESFLNYDFAGANVYVPRTKTFFSGTINGGFSLRKKSAMLDCLKKIDIQKINNYIKQMKTILPENNSFIQTEYDSSLNEDVFFIFACEILQKTMPDIYNRINLSIEFEEMIYYNIVPENGAAVYHGWNKNYHSANVAKHFLSKSEYFKGEPAVLKCPP